MQVASTVVNVVACTKGELPPSSVALPAGFTVEEVRACTRTVLGIAYDWRLVVIVKAAAGDDSKERRQIEVPVDAQGREVQPFYLDNLILALLAAYLSGLEWRYGTTLGKLLLRIYVQPLGGASAPDMLQAGERTLLRVLGLVGLVLVNSIVTSPGDNRIGMRLVIAAEVLELGIWFDVAKLLAIAYLLSAIATMALRHLPLHGRWAGTEAVRTGAAPRK